MIRSRSSVCSQRPCCPAGMDALACRFGSSYTVGGSAVSSALLRCETPPFSPATIDRALTVDTSINGGAEFAGAQTYFEPLDTVLVSSLTPRAGTKMGGTVVNVFGVGFTVDEPVWCRFGTTGQGGCSEQALHRN